MSTRVFNESQSYRGTWIMYLIILTELPVLILLLVLFSMNDDKQEMGIALAVVLGAVGLSLTLILNVRLETRIDDYGVSYRYFPFIRNWRKIEKAQISSIRVINYSPITDYGGWGLKGNKTAKAYSILGDEGILIDIGKKKKIMIGTSKAKELRVYLENWKED
ncbi:hypothetical protein [Algoriphagus pacificus]|uniref:PH domain-containing protein n=1 Tax=Algoriphagus pacificus TaxID=2811234 RepID=A0ABS3CLC9_9BACT|nr:hypothetical protein [Algoriphagus pacificus]MBN7817903.1 hypothetical protein [Algoriphagus pacificus]